MKIALPSSNGKLDEHFGHCKYFTIYEVDEGEIKGEYKFISPQGCGCKSNIIPQLAENGVTVMLAGNMGPGAVTRLEDSGIKVIRGCSGELESVVRDYLGGKLEDSHEECSHHGPDGCGHDHNQ